MCTFYDDMALEYDEVVDQTARRQAADEFMRFLNGRRPIASLLDVACGTGLYARAAQASGISEVVGVDLSDGMLKVAKKATQQAALDIDFRQMSMDDLSALPSAHFDAVICMGNSVPHMPAISGLERALSEFVRVAAPGGLIAVQLLNYNRVLDKRERLVGVQKRGGIEHIRFYDFHQHTLGFNHLRIDWNTQPAQTSLRTTVLTPFRHNEITHCLKALRIDKIECFGSPLGAPFDEAKSEVLLVLGTVTRLASDA